MDKLPRSKGPSKDHPSEIYKALEETLQEKGEAEWNEVFLEHLQKEPSVDEGGVSWKAVAKEVLVRLGFPGGFFLGLQIPSLLVEFAPSRKQNTVFTFAELPRTSLRAFFLWADRMLLLSEGKPGLSEGAKATLQEVRRGLQYFRLGFETGIQARDFGRRLLPSSRLRQAYRLKFTPTSKGAFLLQELFTTWSQWRGQAASRSKEKA
jgi:hypothetical protein